MITFRETSYSSLTRSDGVFGGERVSGAIPDDSTFLISGSNNIIAPYILHISTVIPEIRLARPATQRLLSWPWHRSVTQIIDKKVNYEEGDGMPPFPFYK